MLKNYDVTKTYLIACSGGPDSMALLDMLVNHNFNIIVVHVNYKTRLESDSEEKLVVDYCIKNNLNYEIVYFDNNYKGSFEDAARKFRYNFFSIIYKKYNCHGLFVAHHKDDLIETYLLKKQRNVVNESYLIKEETIIYNMRVLRPLLYKYDKEDLLNYCNVNNICYGVDKTNFMDVTPRNIIRKELKNVDKNVIFDEAINAENKLIDTRNDVNKFIKYYPLYICDLLKDKSDMWLQIFLYEICDKKYKKYVNKSLLLVMKDFMNSDKPSLYHLIKDSYYLQKEYGKISMVEKKDKCFSITLNSLSYISTPYFKITSTGLKMNGIYVEESDFPITIRNYKVDDKIKLKEGSKKVSRLFIDKKVPLNNRKNIPIIENSDGEIIFVYGLYRKYGLKHVKNNLFIDL